MPRHIVCLTFDFDTQSGFIARGMTTPTPLSRGEFGAMASGRILKFLKERGIKATWFTPGFTIESWPKESAAVVEGGHEIGHHSWAHIPNANQSRDEEEADLVRANENIRKLTGRTARGYRSPSWDLSAAHHRSAHQARLSLQLEPDGRRLHSLSRAARRQGRARQALRLRRGDVADRDADLVVARRPSAFRVHPHAADRHARPAAGARGDAELARRVSLHEEDRRLGRADLHHAPLRHRPRLPHAGAGGFGRRSSPTTARCS